MKAKGKAVKRREGEQARGGGERVGGYGRYAREGKEGDSNECAKWSKQGETIVRNTY